MSKMGKKLNFNKIEIFDINRKVIAHSTSKSWTQVPHVSYLFEPDITDFFEYFKIHKAELSHKINISFNTVMLKVISEGLKASPELNSLLEYHPKYKSGIQKFSSDINIALPWLLEDGKMITPVVKNIENKNLIEITKYIEDLTRKINNTDIDAMQYKVSLEESISDILHFRLGVFKQIISAKFGPKRLKSPTKKQLKAYNKIPNEDKIIPSDIFDASVLVSNIGSVFQNQKGSLTMLEIINPQIFVIGLNAVQERPTVIENKGKKEIAIRQILPLTMTFDHRAVDFSNLIPFQNTLDNIFTNPEIIKEWT